MHTRPLSIAFLTACLLLAGWSGHAREHAASDLREPVWTGERLLYPEGASIPRGLTDVERRYLERHPLTTFGIDAPPPEGPVHCPAEYEPMDGLLIAWEGRDGWKSILSFMGARITTIGDADLYVVVDDELNRAAAESSLAAGGSDMSRVQFVVSPTDTIWIRDYGPRTIYEGDCRSLVDHTYNRPRLQDNGFPRRFSAFKNHAYYEIPLVHGGGNYHLDNLGKSFTSRLVNGENPALSEAEIHDLWLDYQNLDTSFFDPYPRSVDSTQHIDMWLQVIADDAVVISDWPFDQGSTQDLLCDAAESEMAARGYTVHRVPARSLGTHYTYTNVVMVNDLVLIPSYAHPDVVAHNDEALAAWQAALPDKTIVQVDAEELVTSSGVLHCIVMHVPAPRGGSNPTALLKNPNDCAHLVPGSQLEIRWISDDDKGVETVDILLSTDGGASFPTPIATREPDSGSFDWTVPDLTSNQARLRVVAHDADGHSGFDESDADFVIAATPMGPEPPHRLLAVKAGADLRFRFTGHGGAGAYNLYAGQLGAFGLAASSLCHLDTSDPSLADNGDGTFSYTQTPAVASRWFVVSASNCLDESPLTHPTAECGPAH